MPIEKIFEYLKKNSKISNTIGQELTGKSSVHVLRYLNALCDAGILKKAKQKCLATPLDLPSNYQK